MARPPLALLCALLLCFPVAPGSATELGPACSAGSVAYAACEGPATSEDLVAQLGHTYQRTRRPPCGSGSLGGPTEVQAQLYLTQVNEVDQKKSQVSLNGYLRLWWQDPRLAFNSTCADEIDVSGKDLHRIWQPDVYIDNSIELVKEEHLVMVSPDGSVRSSTQLHVKVKASLHLGKLPYDDHTCIISLASFSKNIKQLRLMAKDGVVGSESSGVGIVAAAMTSSMWTFGEDGGDSGFETPGRVETIASWDYLHLEFTYHRQPKYFLDQVITPSLLFLLVAYVQFFVDSAAVPARAAIAIISVLVMRTMTNSVYQSLPQGSQRMWLGDFLTTAGALTVVAVCEFGLVQMFMLVEKRQTAELAGLLKSKPVAERLKKIHDEEGVTMLELLARCQPQRGAPSVSGLSKATLEDVGVYVSDERGVGCAGAPVHDRKAVEHVSIDQGEEQKSEPPQEEQKSEPTQDRQSDFMKKHRIKEADLLFIKHAEGIFRSVDSKGLNQARPAEVRKALAHFNIHLTSAQTASLMCMFLRDEGNATPHNEMEVRMTFCQFQFFLMRIDSYPRDGFKYAGSFLDGFLTMPPSKRVDAVARRVFPLLVVAMMVVFYSLLPVY